MATKFDEIRRNLMNEVEALLEDWYDVLHTGSQELCVPIVGEDDEEGYLVITFKVPKGSRDGDAYDGYAMAEEYQLKCEAKTRKAAEAAKKKAEKIERDKKMRAQKAEAKAKREG